MKDDLNNGPVPVGKDPSVDERIEEYQRQLRRLASKLSLIEARERREIASDLHDHIGQALAFVAQKVTALQGNSIFSGMDGEFSEILSILRQAIRYTRDLTVEISPPILYELGLPAALGWLCERMQDRYGINVRYVQKGGPTEISEDIEVFVFKSVQELLVNVAKHSGADRALIEADWGKDPFVVTVSDEGCGFDTSRLDPGSGDGCCFGLFSIRERLSYIGGTLNVESQEGRGTAVTLEAPYSAEPEGEA